MVENFQVDTWSSDFGKEYTERNLFTVEDTNKVYSESYGIDFHEVVKSFFEDLGIYDKRVLEVGCNIGSKLNYLQFLGFKELYGIDLQAYAVEKAKSLTKGINIIQALGNDIPFKDKYFSLVFTCGVLIHISPDDINAVLDEIYRCSNDYIWGFEYYAEDYTEVNYRGNNNLLWKADFAKLFLDRFPDLTLVKEQILKYVKTENMDKLYLLKKNK